MRVLCALLYLVCALGMVGSFVERLRPSLAPPAFADWRSLAFARELGVVCADSKHLSPVERARLIAVNWERGLRPARVCTLEDCVAGRAPRTVLTTFWLSAWMARRLAPVYTNAVSNDFVILWRR